jgi:type IV pilus assembly protein PilW
MEKRIAQDAGFTLLELLIASLLAVVVSAAAFSFYSAQNKAYIVQDRLVELQQNLRAGIELISRDIRLAGLDPRQSTQFGFIETTDDGTGRQTDSQNIAFTIDDDLDGIVDNNRAEQVAYRLNSNVLQKYDPGGWQPIADDIEAMGFAYAIDNNADGQLDVDAVSHVVIWAVPGGGGTWLDLDTDNNGAIDLDDDTAGEDTGITVNMDDIRSVRIWLLARTRNRDEGFVDGRTYKVGLQELTPGDARHRRLLETTVKCRNRSL